MFMSITTPLQKLTSRFIFRSRTEIVLNPFFLNNLLEFFSEIYMEAVGCHGHTVVAKYFYLNLQPELIWPVLYQELYRTGLQKTYLFYFLIRIAHKYYLRSHFDKPIKRYFDFYDASFKFHNFVFVIRTLEETP